MSIMQNKLRIAVFATVFSAGMVSVVSAQTAPLVPAPASTPIPPVAPSFVPETFFNAVLQSGSWQAKDALDESVHNRQKEKIGEISDFVVDGEGRVLAVIIGIGGFLGMGEKDVAVTYKALHMNFDDKGKAQYVLDVTKEALKAAPAYKPITIAKRG